MYCTRAFFVVVTRNIRLYDIPFYLVKHNQIKSVGAKEI